jgi:hypothetical protein
VFGFSLVPIVWTNFPFNVSEHRGRNWADDWGRGAVVEHGASAADLDLVYDPAKAIDRVAEVGLLIAELLNDVP